MKYTGKSCGWTFLGTVFLAELLLIAAPTWLAAAGSPGPEILINTTRPGYQFSAAAGMNAAGDFVVAWVSPGSGTDEFIYAQRFNSDSTPAGPEIRVDDPTFVPFLNSRKRDPALAMEPSGDFVVVWTGGTLSFGDQFNYTFSAAEIYGQRFTASGTPAGPNFVVNTSTAGVQEQPSVASDGFGQFVVAWTGFGDGNGTTIRAQRFDSATGLRAGSEFTVNSYTIGNQFRPAVAMNPSEPVCPPPFYCLATPPDFYVVWEGAGSDDTTGIFARGFNGGNNAPVGGQFRVNTYVNNTQETPVAGMDDDGNLVVAWSGEGSGGVRGVYGQRFSRNGYGIRLGSEFEVAPLTGGVNHFTRLSLGVGPTGKFIVAWNDLENNMSANEVIFGRDFDAAGAPQGIKFFVSQSSSFFRPAVRMDRVGNFIGAFEGGNDGSFSGIWARYFAIPSLYINDVRVAERDSGTTNATFTVTVFPFSTQTVSVAYATTNYTATSGSDYQPTNGILIFAPGVSATQIVVRVNGDTQPEADEMFHFVLSNATNAPIAKGKGVGTIVNDDGCPQPRLHASMRGTSNCILRFEAASSCTYHLEFKTSLTETAWAPLRTVGNISGTVAAIDANATTRTRFYRAWVQ